MAAGGLMYGTSATPRGRLTRYAPMVYPFLGGLAGYEYARHRGSQRGVQDGLEKSETSGHDHISKNNDYEKDLKASQAKVEELENKIESLGKGLEEVEKNVKTQIQEEINKITPEIQETNKQQLDSIQKLIKQQFDLIQEQNENFLNSPEMQKLLEMANKMNSEQAS